MNKEDKTIIRQKYLELQILEQQINEVYNQQQIFNQRFKELKKLEENLSFLENSKISKELISQIGPNIFIKAELKDNKNVFVTVGANVVVEKTIPEAIKLVSTQSQEINNNIELLNHHIIITSEKAQTIQHELEMLQEESK